MTHGARLVLARRHVLGTGSRAVSRVRGGGGFLGEPPVDAGAVDAEAAGGVGDVAARLVEGAMDEEILGFGQIERECRDES